MLWAGCNGGDLIAPETGGLVVQTATETPPPGLDRYSVSVDGGTPQPIAINGVITLADLPAGPHSIQLAGVPEGCVVAGDNPRVASVPVGGRTEVAFDVTCSVPPGAVTVITSTTGLAPDPDGYTVQVDLGVEWPIGVNATLVLPDLVPGPHSLRLTGVAANCTVGGANPRAIETVAGTPMTVTFGVTCVAGTLQFTPMNSGTNADLPEVWGTAANDVFVVGEVETDGGNGVASVVLHYGGAEWQGQHRQDDLRLRGVWGSSATDVFAVGFHFLAPGAVVLHFDGTQWTQTEDFIGLSEEFALMSVWGSSAADVFAVGVAFDGRFAQSFIMHYDGAGWRRMDAPAETSPRLTDVWGSGPSDVYAVGRDEVRDPKAAVILRYDGVAWSPALEEEGLILNAVWGSSPIDVFAVGFEVNDNFDVTGTVRHFDGARWSRMAVPAVGVLQDVWGSSPADVYAVGDDGVVLHYDGSAWTRSRPTRRTLLGVWGSSAVDVFLVGDRGTIVHGAP